MNNLGYRSYQFKCRFMREGQALQGALRPETQGRRKPLSYTYRARKRRGGPDGYRDGGTFCQGKDKRGLLWYILESPDKPKRYQPARPPEEGAGGKEFVLEFGFCGDLGRPVDLKKVKAAAAAQAERQVICELIKRVHLKKGALAKLLGIDAKTLRAKLKEIEDDQ